MITLKNEIALKQDGTEINLHLNLYSSSRCLYSGYLLFGAVTRHVEDHERVPQVTDRNTYDITTRLHQQLTPEQTGTEYNL